MKITSLEQTDLKRLLQSSFFKIPRFQRPYSWDRGNIEDFWLDCIEEGGEGYFIGSIVVYPTTGEALAVVDGQQRLTTTTLLLCALRDAFAVAGLQNQATGVHGFVERPNVENKATFVLDTETSKPYLQEYIQKREAPDIEVDRGFEENSLKAAFDLLSQRVEALLSGAGFDEDSLSEKERAQAARAALTKARDQLLSLRVLRIEVDNEDDAYIVFETLNTRGKDLELVDMVKNHLLRLISVKTTNVDPAKEKWAEIRRGFDQSQARINVNAFIHHSWLSRYPYVAEQKLFKQLRSQVRQRQAKGFLDTLHREARLYREIKEPGARSWKKDERPLARSLHALVSFEISQPLPLVLSLLRAYDDDKITLKQCKRALWTIEAFHFSHATVAQKSSSGGMSYLYARFARELYAAGSRQQRGQLLRDLQAALRERRPTRMEFVEGFVRFRVSKDYTGDRRTVKYILDRHYRHFGGRPTTDLSMMTIEHLGSQSGTSLEPGTIASIGNLIFVSEALNDRLKNRRFAKKREILANQSEIWIPQEVLEAKQWGKRAIDKRAVAMAEECYDGVWSF